MQGWFSSGDVSIASRGAMTPVIFTGWSCGR
jgi:hypothetical protein